MDVKVQRGEAIIQPYKQEEIVELKYKVNPEKAIVMFCGSICGYSDISGYSTYWDARLDLIDEKHIKVTRGYPSSYSMKVSWQTLEFVKE